MEALYSAVCSAVPNSQLWSGVGIFIILSGKNIKVHSFQVVILDHQSEFMFLSLLILLSNSLNDFCSIKIKNGRNY